MSMTIFREFTFEAAHWLPKVPEGHKCRNVHGHTYRVIVSVCGAMNPEMGWLEDFGDIDHCWAVQCRHLLDHRALNDVDGLANPTCENIARWIWERMKPMLVDISSVKVFEGPRGGCEYTGEDA